MSGCYGRDCVNEKITVIDEWEAGRQKFRLVDQGAGPFVLQLAFGDVWVNESTQYVHGILCGRIIQLKTKEATK
jgi:hypothetical protein